MGTRTQWSMARVRRTLSECDHNFVKWRTTYEGGYKWVLNNGFISTVRDLCRARTTEEIRETTRPYALYADWYRENFLTYLKARRRDLLRDIWKLAPDTHRYKVKVRGKVLGEDGAFYDDKEMDL
jgi:hypothetical protein